jgi:AAHS family benzoate transporter-like MFS transporter
MALPLEQNFMAISIPAVIATIAVLFIDHQRSASASENRKEDGLLSNERPAALNSALSSK